MATSSRATSDHSADELRITIPSVKDLPAVFFYAVVLYFIGAVQLMMLRNIVSGEIDPVLICGAVFGAFGCIFVAASIAWLVAGEEVIVTGAGTLSLRQQAFGIGRTKRYKAASIRALRALPQAIVSHDPITPFRGVGDNSLRQRA